jgi:hypothetical protein
VQHDSDEPISVLESTALRAVSGVERALFGWSISRNVRNDKSRFYALLPRYGPVGAARVIVANLWLLPAIILLVASVVLSVTSRPGDPDRAISYVLFVAFLVCAILMIGRAVSASRVGTRFRKT